MTDALSLNNVPVLVVGVGVMGIGIAQVAASAGHEVWLYDAKPGAADAALSKLTGTLEGLQAKGKLTAEAVAATLGRLKVAATLDDAAHVGLVVEAIVERLDIKRSLFQDIEKRVSDDCVLATNTSSISVTAIANGLKRPQRLVGMHFFNPVPLMKLVEVVWGLQTAPAVAQAVFDLSLAWGKTPVMATSTPGFIVNRIARPYYAETLALLQEKAAPPAVLDACLRAAGFRMGPCELMDLIGHDTNFSVTSSVYEANFYDKRFVPSLVQKELVDGGLLGRKTGQGFYSYAEGAPAPKDLPLPAADCRSFDVSGRAVTVLGQGPMTAAWIEALSSRGAVVVAMPGYDRVGLRCDGVDLWLTDGRTASSQGDRVAVFDWTTGAPQSVLAYAVSVRADETVAAVTHALLLACGVRPVRVADAAGLVVARTLSMLMNEAADAVHQGVCDEAGADAAMKLGVNYPAGPFEWLATWGAPAVVNLLDAMDAHCRGERYRVSPWLRLRA